MSLRRVPIIVFGLLLGIVFGEIGLRIVSPVKAQDLLPLTYFTKLTRDVMVLHHHVWSEGAQIWPVLVWGAIGLAAAIRTFRWQPREG